MQCTVLFIYHTIPDSEDLSDVVGWIKRAQTKQRVNATFIINNGATSNGSAFENYPPLKKKKNTCCKPRLSRLATLAKAFVRASFQGSRREHST